MNQREKEMKDEISYEKDRRRKVENQNRAFRTRFSELKAFKSAVHGYMHTSRGTVQGNRGGIGNMSNNKSDTTRCTSKTGTSSALQDKEPLPSFLKALATYDTGLDLS